MISLEQNMGNGIGGKCTPGIIREYNLKFAKAIHYYHDEDNSINLRNMCCYVGVTLEKNLCTA